MEYQNVANLLGNVSDKAPKFNTKKWIEFHDQSGNTDNRYKQSKQISFKNQSYNQIYLIIMMHVLF